MVITKRITLGILISLTVFFPAFAGRENQTDWSGGESSAFSIPDVVTDWNDEFESSNGISWLAFPGDLYLGATPIETPIEHSIDDYFDGALKVRSGDIDNDGDTDIASVSFNHDVGGVSWWSNDNGTGTLWTEHVVDDTGVNKAEGLVIDDIDGDGNSDLVVVYISSYYDNIIWYENDGTGTNWTAHIIEDDFPARSVSVGDIDGDNYKDIIASSLSQSQISWWENPGTSGDPWEEHTVALNQSGPFHIYSADINNDGLLDVLAAIRYADEIAWWENVGGGSSWTKHTVDNNFDWAAWVHSEDIDGDDDLDILGAALYGDEITWWENNNGSGTSWTERNIESGFDGAFSVYSEDLDGDGDMDVIGGGHINSDVVWWSNDDGSGETWTKYAVDEWFNGTASVWADDVNGDGSMDVIATCSNDGEKNRANEIDIAWWEITDFKPEGDLASDILDTEVDTSTADLYWGPIDWNSETPGNTTISIEVRASNNSQNMGNWAVVTSSGDDLSDYVDDDTRYLQYKVSLETTDEDVSPAFKNVGVSWTVSNKSNVLSVPVSFSLHPATPNPSINGTVSIGFTLPYACEVELALYDIKGRKISVLAEGKHQPGEYTTNKTGLSKGIYIYRMITDDFSDAKKVVIK